jgi:hypothetical protein
MFMRPLTFRKSNVMNQTNEVAAHHLLERTHGPAEMSPSPNTTVGA